MTSSLLVKMVCYVWTEGGVEYLFLQLIKEKNATILNSKQAEAKETLVKFTPLNVEIDLIKQF